MEIAAQGAARPAASIQAPSFPAFGEDSFAAPSEKDSAPPGMMEGGAQRSRIIKAEELQAPGKKTEQQGSSETQKKPAQELSLEEYEAAFSQFESQSEMVIKEGISGEFKLAGKVRRHDAELATAAIVKMMENQGIEYNTTEIVGILNSFPGVGRRFEKLVDGVYTDYAHHPEEIAATIEIAREEAKIKGLKGVVVVYQPHQNIRQHEVRNGYREAFLNVDKIFWLPTYLVRENPDLAVITPEEFVEDLENRDKAEAAELNDDLAIKLHEYVKEGYLVILMTAGPADEWLRGEFLKNN